MRIADVMTRELPTVGPGDSVADAARQMAEAGAKALPVCDGERLAGIITDWDVTRAVAARENPGEVALSDYMTREVVTVAPDARLTEASDAMAGRRIHHLLVVRDGDQFAGMVHLDVDWSEMGGMESPMATFSAPI
jgi:CBS domain-containing protein